MGVYYLINLIYPLSTLTYVVLILLVLLLVTFLAYILQLVILDKFPDYFVHVIISAIVIRLIVFGIFNFILIYLDRELAVDNVIIFFAAYLGFTLLELVVLFRKIILVKPPQN